METQKFNKALHIKLVCKAMNQLSGSQKQKKILIEINKLRKVGGLQPLTV